MPVLKERFLSDVLSGKLTVDEIISQSSFYGLNLSSKYYCVARIEFSGKQFVSKPEKRELEIEKALIKNLLLQKLDFSSKIHTIMDDNEHISILFCLGDNPGETDLQSADYYSSFVVEKLKNFMKHLNSEIFSLTIGVSNVYEGLDRIAICYLEAAKALEGKIYIGINNIISYKELAYADNSAIFKLDREKLKLILLSGNKEALNNYVNEYFDFYRINYNVMVKNRQFIIFEIVSSAFDILRIHTSGGMDCINYNILELMLNYETLDELQREIGTFLLNCIKYLEKSRDEHSVIIVDRIVEYIKNNYMKNINLKTVANDFSINPSYLSRVFCERTGISFTDYINETRMLKVKELIKNTDLNINRISRSAGYINERYFSRLFKKREGLTPQEYRTHK